MGGPVLPPEVSRPKDEPASAATPQGLGVYVFLNFVALLVLTAAALGRTQALGIATFSALGALVVFSLVALSALLERRPWARPVEGARVLLVLGLAVAFGPRLVGLLFGSP